MHKRDLIRKISEVLKENGIRKYVAPQRTVFHITDDNGGHSDFVIKKSQTRLMFTTEDIAAILDAYLAVVEDALKRGDEITIQGFGTFSLKKRAARKSIHPNTGEWVDVAERYIPKFAFGDRLRTAARLYSLSAEALLREADTIISDQTASEGGDDDGID